MNNTRAVMDECSDNNTLENDSAVPYSRKSVINGGSTTTWDLFNKRTLSSLTNDTSSTTTTDASDEENSLEKEKNAHKIVDSEEDINPWSKHYLGVPLSYLCVGFMLGGSTSILYPVLIVQEGVSSSVYSASVSIVTIFWSYKIVFGTLSDCFPIFGLKRKSYMCLGWLLCAAVMVALSTMGENITSKHLVLTLSLANLGYVMADVAADGFMVWIAHREPVNKRGRTQTLVYATNCVGQFIINIIILFGFAGPEANCPGYQPDPNLPCTNNASILERNSLSQQYPDTWCHMKCPAATFNSGLSVSNLAQIIAALTVICIPFYFYLSEDKTPRESFKKFMSNFWGQLQRRTAWQIMFYAMTSHITFGVANAAKPNANYVWLHLNTSQNQIMVLMEKVVFFLGLNLVRKYALHMSWRKLIWCGSMLVTFFNMLYFLIVFDILRNPWFYIFTDVSQSFMYTLNFMSTLFSTVEISEPGFEAITYSLITTAANAVTPLSAVISYQLLSFFPSLHSQQSIAQDTPAVRADFATLHLITIVINLTSLLFLPLLPRQKKETRDLVALGETSRFWGRLALISALTFLFYSSIATFMTVASADVYGCFKILGGQGCSANESSAPAYVLVALVLLYCYGINFYLSFWPIIKGEQKASFSIFF